MGVDECDEIGLSDSSALSEIRFRSTRDASDEQARPSKSATSRRSLIAADEKRT